MAFIQTGLTKNAEGTEGFTSHYAFSYDSSLQKTAANPTGPEPLRTNAVIAACEGDFNQMSAWFGNIALDVDFRIKVNVTQNGGGAAWSLSGRDLTVTINPAGGSAATIRYLLVAEMVEQFMRAQGKGWFGAGTEGSEGEGLSRFLGAQFLAINSLGTPPAGFDNSNNWLSGSRADFVNNIRTSDDGPDEITGCSLLFIYYLFSQLGFGVEVIVGAAANKLGGVYKNLTGDAADPFPAFKHQLDIVYPGTSKISGPDLDNPYPIGKKILWHNSSTNETQIWFMNKERVARRATVVGETGAAAFVGPPWRIIGTGNMNVAGDWDIVWHNSSTNETQIWFMNGERIARRATVVGETGAGAFVGLPWRIVGTGDMNADGKLDIVWHNSSTNETQIWFMNGEHIARRATVVGETGAPAFVGPPWRIVAIGDMNGDGKSDIVWHNSSTNETQIWFMNGEHIARRATVVGETGAAAFVGPPWRIVGTADMMKDKQADIVWHNSSTNETQIWFMNSEHVVRRATVVGETGAAVFVGPPWRIIGSGDVYGDGIMDVLWHNSASNDIQFWFMDGPKIKGRNGVVDENGNIIRIGMPWNIASVAGLAGESAILWHNSSTNDIQFWFMDGPKIKGRNAVVDENGNIIRVGAPWQITGVTGLAGEFAILWHNSSTNDIQFWFMDGPKIKGRNAVVDENGNIIRVGAPWQITGVTGLAGEFAILWHNSSTNDIQFWFMDGPKIKGRNGAVDENGNIIRVGAPWNIAGVTGPASESAILWQNGTTNDIQFWFMDGPKIKGRNGVVDENGNIIRVGSPWNIAGAGGA